MMSSGMPAAGALTTSTASASALGTEIPNSIGPGTMEPTATAGGRYEKGGGHSRPLLQGPAKDSGNDLRIIDEL